MPINKYVLDIQNNRGAAQIASQMNFWGQVDNYPNLTRDSSITSWTEGEGNHEWEEKAYTFEGLEKIKVKLHLNTPHYNDNGIERPMWGKETLGIVLTKKRGGALGRKEIEEIIDRIEAETGVRGIRKA